MLGKCPAMLEEMFAFSYELDYDDTDKGKLPEYHRGQHFPPLLINAQMYRLGLEFNSFNMKRRAEAKFVAAAIHDKCGDDFISTVEFLYKHEVDDLRKAAFTGLRAVLEVMPDAQKEEKIRWIGGEAPSILR